MILTRRLRNLPITAVRFVRAVKYFFAEHIKVPRDVVLQQVVAIHHDVSKPLLGAAELKEGGFSLNFIQNLLRSMAGLRVHELHPWLLSSAYIFVYFIISRRKNDSICMEAYDYMLKGETPSSEVIEHVVNNIIFKCGNLNVTNNNNCEGLTQNQIHNFRRTLQRDCCQNELQVLVAWPEDLGLICSNNELGNMESEMLHYFKLFEINCSTTDVVNKLNYLENKDTEESSVHNFSNSIEDNSNLTSLKKSKNVDKKLDNCSLQDENQVENITKRILRPRINANNELHKKDEIEGRITRSKSKISLINLDVGDKESQDNSKKIIESNDVYDVEKEHEFSCRRITPFVGKTLRKPLYGGPERPIEINYSNDTPESDLINHTMQLDIETFSVISDDVDTAIQERSNELQDIPVNEENEIVKSVVSSKDINEKSNYSSNVNKILDSFNCNEELQSVSTAKALFNANADILVKDLSKITKSSLNKVKAEVNFNKELSRKNSTPKPVSQYAKEKADIVKSDSNDNISCSLNSSTKKDEVSINLKNVKSNDSTPNNESHAISINDSSKYKSIQSFIENCCMVTSYDIPNKNKFANTSGTRTDLIINPVQLEKVTNSEILNEIDKVKQKNSNKMQDIVEKKENKTVKPITDSVFNENKICIVNDNAEAGVNLNQLPQNPSHVQSKSLDSSSNSSVMDVPISAASTSSKLTASKNNNSSTLRKESITVVDLDIESTMLNLKRINQSPQELPTVKKLCFESRSNNCAMDFPIPITATISNLTASNNNSDSTLKRKSIIVVDLDLEPCMLNSNATSQPLQDPSNVKMIHPDATSKSSAMDIPIPVSITNSSCTDECKDSSSYMKEVTTKVENPDLEIVEIRKNNTFGTSTSGIKMSSNTASMPTLSPGPLAILFANSDLRKYSKRKTAAAINKTIPCINGSPSSQEQSQPRQNAVDNLSRRSIPMDCQSKNASMNQPVNGLNFTSGQKVTPAAQASLTEINGVNPVDQDSPPQSQKYRLQDQQQPFLFASSHEVNDNIFSSSFNNDSSKFQSNIQKNTDTTNVGGNFSVQAGPLPLNHRLTSSTVFDTPSTSKIQLTEKNKIGTAYQEDIFQSTLGADMSTVGDQFPLNQAHGEYSNTSSVKSQLVKKVRITPLQQPNFQFNGKRYPTYCSDVQHNNLVNNTSGLRNCLPAQQQQQSMRFVFNSATANSPAAVAKHSVNEVLTSESKFWQAPVNLDNLHYFCDYCPIQLKFESAELLYQHVNVAHNYTCHLCQNRYPTHQALLQHTDEHTENTRRNK